MFRLSIILVLSVALSACTLSGKKRLGSNSLVSENTTSALIFQSNEKFASFLSDAEKAKAQEIELKALNFGKPAQQIGWSSDKGVDGSVTAFQLFRVGQSQCRKFKHDIQNPKQVVSAEATACRDDDGEWNLVR